MSLTLFPITALLLLLSGVGSPVHAAGYTETVAALRKQFLGVFPMPAQTKASSKPRTPHSGWHPAPASENLCKVPAPSKEISQNGPIRPWERKQYRTRFGFAEGAYLAMGPPVGTPSRSSAEA